MLQPSNPQQDLWFRSFTKTMQHDQDPISVWLLGGHFAASSVIINRRCCELGEVVSARPHLVREA